MAGDSHAEYKRNSTSIFVIMYNIRVCVCVCACLCTGCLQFSLMLLCAVFCPLPLAHGMGISRQICTLFNALLFDCLIILMKNADFIYVHSVQRQKYADNTITHTQNGKQNEKIVVSVALFKFVNKCVRVTLFVHGMEPSSHSFALRTFAILTQIHRQTQHRKETKEIETERERE